MNYFAKNLKHLRNLKEISQEFLAEELSITRSRIGSYEESRSEPPIELLAIISNYFKLPIDVLVKKDLTLSNDNSFIEVGNQRVLFPIVVDGNNEDLIEIVATKATAGYLDGYDDPEYIEQLQKIKLPFLPTGKHRAFPIKGDSMLPVKDGAYVIGRYIENFNDLKNGKTYIIVTLDEGIVYKRVILDKSDSEHITLKSDNKNYPPYKVHRKHLLELWEFTCCINTQEYDENELKLSSITQMLNELGIELKQFIKTN